MFWRNNNVIITSRVHWEIAKRIRISWRIMYTWYKRCVASDCSTRVIWFFAYMQRFHCHHLHFECNFWKETFRISIQTSLEIDPRWSSWQWIGLGNGFTLEKWQTISKPSDKKYVDVYMRHQGLMSWRYSWAWTVASTHPVDTRRNNNVIILLKRRCDVVSM